MAVAAPPSTDAAGTPSIHDLEHAFSLTSLPPFDSEDRALCIDRVLPAVLGLEEYSRSSYQPLRSWARAPMHAEVRASQHSLEVVCRPVNSEDRALAEKRISFDSSGGLTVSYRWNSIDLPADAFFSTEISLGHRLAVQTTPEVEVWKFPIHTVAKSERGLDETLQGESFTPRWPVPLGEGSVTLLVER